MGHLSTRIKFLVLIQQSPSVDGCVDAAAKILTEASILRPFSAKLLPGPILDFLAEAIKILDSREVTAPFGLWLVHRDTRHGGGSWRVEEGEVQGRQREEQEEGEAEGRLQEEEVRR